MAYHVQGRNVTFSRRNHQIRPNLLHQHNPILHPGWPDTKKLEWDRYSSVRYPGCPMGHTVGQVKVPLKMGFFTFFSFLSRYFRFSCFPNVSLVVPNKFYRWYVRKRLSGPSRKAKITQMTAVSLMIESTYRGAWLAPKKVMKHFRSPSEYFKMRRSSRMKARKRGHQSQTAKIKEVERGVQNQVEVCKETLIKKSILKETKVRRLVGRWCRMNYKKQIKLHFSVWLKKVRMSKSSKLLGNLSDDRNITDFWLLHLRL